MRWPVPFRTLMSTRLVVTMAIGAALLVLMVSIGLLAYAATAVDDITEAREQHLMSRTLERRLTQIGDDVASVSVWNDAYDKSVRMFDADWARVNYAEYFHDYMHHDVSVLLDRDGRPVYAAEGGKPVDPARVNAFLRAVQPLAALAERRAMARIAAAPQAQGFDRVGVARSAVRAGDRFYLAVASTVTFEAGYARPPVAGRERILISAVELSPAYLDVLGRDFALKGMGVVSATPDGPGVAQLTGPDGASIGAVVWTPDRPGVGVILRGRWLIVGLFVAVVISVAMLVFRIMRTARALEHARDRAEAGERAKADFIANMSHEIRTPLNGVLGMAQAMEADELAPAQRARVRIIRESGASLLAILNDVLDLSKIEAARLELEDTVFRADELAEQVCGMYRDTAHSRGVTLDWDCEPSADGWWRGDAHRIRQVLTNLVSNAIKFTEIGGVRLSVSADAAGVRFQVADSGIGIDPVRADELFAKFTQADTSTTRRFGGTGLGLSICRALVDLMGGRISVASRLGVGSTFTVVLPLARTEAQISSEAASVLPTPPEADAGPLRILAAEDNVTNQLVLRALLEPVNVELTVVGDGEAALEAFQSQGFDLILMDVQMPRMNGVDATRAIRAIESREGRAATPILALTANVMSHQLEAYAEAGMDGHVAKPLDAADLFARIGDAIEARAQAQSAAA